MEIQAEKLAALRSENDRLKAWARDVVAALAKARSQAASQPPNLPAGPPVPQRERVLPDDTATLFSTMASAAAPALRDRNRFSTTLRMAAEQYEILAHEHEQLQRAVAEKDAELAELRARVRNLRRALKAQEVGSQELPPFPLPNGIDLLTGPESQPIAE